MNLNGFSIRNIKNLVVRNVLRLRSRTMLEKGLDMNNSIIEKVGDPSESNHAVNKKYCDQNAQALAYAPRFAKFDITGDNNQLLMNESLSKNWNNAITVSSSGPGTSLQVQEAGVYMCYVSILLEVPAIYRNSYVMITLEQPKGPSYFWANTANSDTTVVHGFDMLNLTKGELKVETTGIISDVFKNRIYYIIFFKYD